SIRSNLVYDQIANDKISLLLEEIPDAVIAINSSGTIMNANQETASFMGLSQSQLRGRNVSEFLIGDLDYSNLRSFSQGFNVFNDVSVRAKGKIYNIVMKKSIIGNYNGNPLILVTFKRKQFKAITAPSLIPNQYYQFDDLIGESNEMKKIKNIAARAAQSTANILIQGESGTGKELVAQAIHQASRPQGPFIAVNCGAFTKELLQSELFGYEEGAFTGAKKGGKPGKFEMADGGTLFLDEIGEMPLDMQVSLLRCLQDKTITRVGGTELRKINLRVVAATNQNLYKQVKDGNFREDLYYRLNVIEITMPPLRERLADLQLMAETLVKQIQADHCSTTEIAISPEVLECLKLYNWPGNVRELRNVMERAIIYSDGEEITLECLPDHIREGKPRTEGNDLRKEYEKMAILEVLNKHKGNISKTAEELGMARSTLYQKIEKLNITY
ncbi:MAG: sigma54 specific transcriptional regulator, partial [Firmicutes bacterium]|nr:sigma54 specific transcriptional regulator [Bacillota bacterium]